MDDFSDPQFMPILNPVIVASCCRSSVFEGTAADNDKAKEQAITERFAGRFEAGLQKIADSLAKPHGIKKQDKVVERINMG